MYSTASLFPCWKGKSLSPITLPFIIYNCVSAQQVACEHPNELCDFGLIDTPFWVANYRGVLEEKDIVWFHPENMLGWEISGIVWSVGESCCLCRMRGRDLGDGFSELVDPPPPFYFPPVFSLIYLCPILTHQTASLSHAYQGVWRLSHPFSSSSLLADFTTLDWPLDWLPI